MNVYMIKKDLTDFSRIVWFLYNEWEKAENSRKGIYWLNLIKTASHDVIIVA